MTFETLAPQVIARLSSDLQISPEKAAGIVGQLGHESGGLQAINEYQPVVPGSRGGFGWAQWTGPRRRQFEAWAKQQGMAVTDPEANYGFLLHELTATPEGRVLDDVRKAPDAIAAGRVFTDRFLRPGVPAYESRDSWTQRALDLVMPTAHAGTVDDEWAELERRFMQNAAAVQSGPGEAEDPWAELERQFAPPRTTGSVSDAAGSARGTFSHDRGTFSVDMSHTGGDAGGYLPQMGSGLLEGITGVFGAPVDLTNAAIGLGMKGINSAFGTELQPAREPFGGSTWWRRGVPLAPPSEETGPQMARRAAQSVGAAAVPMAATARTAGQLLTGLSTALGGGVGGATAQQLFPGSVTAEMLGEALGSLGTGATIAGAANLSARRAAEKAVPSVRDLKRRSSDKFEEAHALGVQATPEKTQGLANQVRAIAVQEGLISPTGRVSEAYPKAREALRMLDDYATGPMNVPQMQTVRKVLADAAGSPDKAERRIATLMLRQFDDFTAPLAPQLSEGRGLYSRAMRGDQLETLRELAGSRAGQYTGSGYENALRTEYRQLNNRIIKGQERGFTPEQQEAIRKVAEGDALVNAARWGGKFAPTGVVSAGLGMGVPFAVGSAVGGPALGSAMGFGAAGAGFLSRNIAERLTNRNAMLAELLARSGGTMPLAIRPELWPQALGAALGGQAAIQSGEDRPYLLP